MHAASTCHCTNSARECAQRPGRFFVEWQRTKPREKRHFRRGGGQRQSAAMSTLDLSGALRGQPAHDMAAMLSKGPAPQSLNLSNNFLGSDLLGKLALPLRSLQGLQEISLSGNSLDDDAMSILAETLPQIDGLASIDLAHNIISSHGAEIIAQMIPTIPSLTDVNLDGME